MALLMYSLVSLMSGAVADCSQTLKAAQDSVITWQLSIAEEQAINASLVDQLYANQPNDVTKEHYKTSLFKDFLVAKANNETPIMMFKIAYPGVKGGES